MRSLHPLTSALAWLALASCGRAELRLPAVLADHMVLQRESETPLWGWGEPGAQVRVKAEWARDEASTLVDAKGTWRVRLDTPPAGGPFTIAISCGGEVLTLRDVLIGEVWLASGQSNMEFRLAPRGGDAGVEDHEQELASADHPRLRMFTVEPKASAERRNDCTGEWDVCTPQTAGSFSAVAYFFARELSRELAVPIGVLHASFGGSPVEAWLGETALRGLKDFDAELDRLQRIRRGDESSRVDHTTPSALFNAMIAPLTPYTLRGAIWYQGESNVDRPEQYGKLFPTLITDWRWQWARGEFPFFWVQIAPYRFRNERARPGALRDMQRRALGVGNTGMAVTLDIDDPQDVHPRNKQEVGRRLARWALATTYGRDIECSGPLLTTMRIEGSAARLHFTHADSGLVARDGALGGFEIAGEDRRFVPATARIDGATVLVSSEQVSAPVAVRYAWPADATASLFNGAGLPAPTFRTDTWPIE